MENREELLTEILRRVQRNYMCIVELERITKELGDALSRNDQESAQLLVKMRQDELEKASGSKQEIRILLNAAPAGEHEKLRSWLSGERRYEPESFEARKIMELSGQMNQIINRTIGIDKAINLKLAGKDSYYHSST